MASKVWTQEQRERAAGQVYSGSDFEHNTREQTLSMIIESWAKGEFARVVPNQFAIDLQCELNEARELLHSARVGQDYVNVYLHGFDHKKADEWLSRNK